MIYVLFHHPVNSDAVALVLFRLLADLDVVTLVRFRRLADLDVVALVRFHRLADLGAMIPVRFHRLVGAYAVLFRHLVNAYAVVPVPFHPLADMDVVAPVLFHLCPVMAVAEDMLMTSKIWSELLSILCNDYSSESTKKSINDYYLYLVGKYAKTRHYFFESFEINVSFYLMSRTHLLCKIVSGAA